MPRPKDHVEIWDGEVYDVTYYGHGPFFYMKTYTPRPKPPAPGVLESLIAWMRSRWHIDRA